MVQVGWFQAQLRLCAAVSVASFVDVEFCSLSLECHWLTLGRVLDSCLVLNTCSDYSSVYVTFLSEEKLLATVITNQLLVKRVIVSSLSTVQRDSISGTTAHRSYTFISVAGRTIVWALLALSTLLSPYPVRQVCLLVLLFWSGHCLEFLAHFHVFAASHPWSTFNYGSLLELTGLKALFLRSSDSCQDNHHSP